MPGTQAQSRLHYQQPFLKSLVLTVQQAAQTFHQSANLQQQQIADAFQFQPQAAYYLANDVQMKRLSVSFAPVNVVDLRRHL